MTMSNKTMQQQIKDWIVTDCLAETGYSEDDIIEIPIADIRNILIDKPSETRIQSANCNGKKNRNKESMEAACARDLGVPLNEEFLQAFREISEEIANLVLKALTEKATLVAAKKDPDKPLN